jgi:hypothetical protein
VGVTAARVIAVRVRDDSALDRLPGVDVEIARRAVEALVSLDDEVFAHCDETRHRASDQ